MLLRTTTTTITTALIASIAMTAVNGKGAVEMTKDNFASELAGKNGFVKFLAPW